MQNHYYDNTHPLRPYTHSLAAMPGTVAPVNALRGEKPTAKLGFWPAEKKGKWTTIEDHRGKDGYLDGQPHTIKAYGPLPDGWSDTPPIPEPPTLEEARAAKIARIDTETSAAILAGFEYELSGQTLHFAYDTNDQQNFADTANASTLAKLGVPGLPTSVTWNGWKVEKDSHGESSRSLVRLTLTPDAFLGLYIGGALVHKAVQMEIGGQRKSAVETATTIAELEAI